MVLVVPKATLRQLVAPLEPQAQEPASDHAAAAECEVESHQAWPNCLSWARLLRRAFDLELRHCWNCGSGELKSIAAIVDRPVIESSSRTWYWTAVSCTTERPDGLTTARKAPLRTWPRASPFESVT